MEINDILVKVAKRCVEKGAALRSRQTTALAEVLVEEIGPRLAVLEDVVAKIVNAEPITHADVRPLIRRLSMAPGDL